MAESNQHKTQGGSIVENPGQEGGEATTNPPEEEIDAAGQARFMERALAESARLQREAQRSLDRRDESRNAIEGGAARMAQLVQEHNAESFGSTSSNPTAYEAP